MAGGLGQFYATAILSALNGGGTFTPPATWYFALMTTAPSDAGGGTEASGGGYARVAVTNNATNFPAASGASQSTGTKIDWGTFSAGLGTIVAIAMYDASSGGNLGPWGPLSVSRLVASGDDFFVNAANGTYTLA